VALGTVLAVLFLTFLDTTIVSVALGSIQYDLGAGVLPLQWVVNAYALVFASLMLTAGTLADRFGRQKVMLAGIAIFCVGSLGCALAPSVGWLIAGRAVMGVGAAASEPGTLSVLRQLYPERDARARALGWWAAVSGMSLALGPVIGGALVGLGDWRTVFWFNLALGLGLLVATRHFVPDSADPEPGRTDLAGFVLGAAALGTVIYAGISGEHAGYRTAWIVALFVLGAACFVGFVVVERRAASPMLELRYLRDPAVAVALGVAFAAYFGVFSIFFLTALYLDLVVGFSGAHLAAVFAPMAVAIVVGSVLSGRWTAREGPRLPMACGCVVAAAGILAARADLTARPASGPLAVVLAVAGLGFGVAVVPLTAAVLGHVPARRSGMAASATNTARVLGSVVGVAVLGAIVNARLTTDFGGDLARQGTDAHLRDYILGLLETGGRDAAGVDIAHPPPLIAPLVEQATTAFRSGVHIALVVSAVLLAVAAVLSALVPRAAFLADADTDDWSD
jgi:EmrB/QacA subfamily drug resistance transporter